MHINQAIPNTIIFKISIDKIKIFQNSMLSLLQDSSQTLKPGTIALTHTLQSTVDECIVEVQSAVIPCSFQTACAIHSHAHCINYGL